MRNINSLTHVPRISYSGKQIFAPTYLEAEVNEHWEEFSKDKSHVFDGRICLVREADILLTNMRFEIHTSIGQYAYWNYLKHHPEKNVERIRSISPTGLVRTKDDYLVLGRMEAQTSIGGLLVATGGALDMDDYSHGPTPLFSPMMCLERELQEELGIFSTRTYFELVGYSLAPKAPRVSLFYDVQLPLTASEVRETFDNHNQYLYNTKGFRELEDVIIVPNSKQEIKDTLKREQPIDYLEELIDFILYPSP